MYYIVDNKITGYLESGQELSTIHPVEYFDNYSEYLHACETHKIEPVDEFEIPIVKEISPAQGRTQLHRLGLFEAVENAVNQAGGETAIFWEYAVTWEINSKVLNQFAEAFQIDLKEFFNEARKINI